MKHLVVLFICISIAGCNLNTKFSLNGDWFIIQQGYNDQDSSGYENMALSLRSNGTYTHFAANFYNYGNWKWDAQTSRITLTPTSGNPRNGTFVFELIKQEKDQIQIQRILKKGNTLVKRKLVDIWFGNKNLVAESPFESKYNQWRIKPTNPETKEQIRERTFQYIQFLKICFQYQVVNKIESLTHGWYPQPFQLHFVNTARMAYSNELIDWNACFYNEEQAVEAYKLISGTMYKLKVHNKETIAERNLDLVVQLMNEFR